MTHTILAYILIITCTMVFCYDYYSSLKNSGQQKPFYTFDLSLSTSLALKGVAAIIIICHHYTLYRYNFVPHNVFTSLIAMNGGNFALIIFFFLSGFGVAKSEILKPNTFASFFKKRIWKISKPCFVIYIITFLIYSLFSFRNISEIDVIENQLNPFIVAISSHDITIELIYNFFFVKMDWYVQTTLIMYTFFFISNVLISENTKEKKTKKICILTFLTTLYYIICYTYLYSPSQARHLNLLKNAKGMCDYLVVGVSVDELVAYKGKHAMIPFEDRIEIVRSCRYVDAAVPQYDMDKLTACKKLGAQILFVGDDWYETGKWKEYEKQFSEEGIKIVYFPYTKGISTTKITNALQQLRGWTTESAKKVLHLNENSNDK